VKGHSPSADLVPDALGDFVEHGTHNVSLINIERLSLALHLVERT
jgi:hypothetical protein